MNVLNTNTRFQREASQPLESHEQILVIDKSAFKLLSLSTIAGLCRIADKHQEALHYFPLGSKLSLGAGGDHGDYTELSSVYLTCSLRLPSGELVGREHISISDCPTEKAFENFLLKLEKGSN